MESKQIKKAIGVALEQETPDGWSFFPYASRFLNTRESNYSVSKIQMLTRCRPSNILSTICTVAGSPIMDHQALVSARQSNKNNKTYRSRLTR